MSFNPLTHNFLLFFFLIFQVDEYKEAEALAKKNHTGVWEYGDITEDDAKEFGRL